jgi:hypothetical protein
MGIDIDGQDPQVYMGVSPIQNPKTIISTRAPGTLDRRYKIGTPWINKSAGSVYFLTTVTNGAANWAISTPGASDVDTLTGDSGGALSPTAGNINILGGTNLDVAGAGSTLTVNVDAASTFATSVTSPLIIASTSVSSPIYTSAAATDTNFNAVAGQDLIFKMGDGAAANKISFVDNASVEVADLDSDGTLTVVNMDGIIGATTPAAGTFTTLIGTTIDGIIGSVTPAAGTFTTVLASTSLSSPIWTSTGAMALNMPAGAFDLTVKLADAAGAQKLSFTDSADAEIANLDSDGQLNLLAGDCVVTRSSASADVTAQVTNSDNTAADSDSFVEVAVGGTSGGNPGIRFQISGGQNYAMGIDNADSDKLVICADNDLGTDVLMKLGETTKDVEVAQGNLVIGAVAKQLQMNGGAVTDFIGQGTLVAGTVTIANTNIAAGDRILITRSALNASPALGDFITTISAATSFTVASYDATGSLENTDVSSFDYFIVRQN